MSKYKKMYLEDHIGKIALESENNFDAIVHFGNVVYKAGMWKGAYAGMIGALLGIGLSKYLIAKTMKQQNNDTEVETEIEES